MVIRLFSSSFPVQRTEVPQGPCSEDFEFGICFRERVLWAGLSRPGVGEISFELPGVHQIRVDIFSFTQPERNVQYLLRM